MGVYIKGMEMPPNCFLCKLSFMSGERLFCSAMKNEEVLRSKIDSNCPLIEVPTPHGDLIDKNALTHEYYKKASYSHLCDCLNNAPTIIESEGDQ